MLFSYLLISAREIRSARERLRESIVSMVFFIYPYMVLFIG
jgi:hypothetical protein